MDWATYTKRRKISLVEFLRDIFTFDDAIKRFRDKGVTNPPKHEIGELLALKSAPSIFLQVAQEQTKSEDVFTPSEENELEQDQKSQSGKENASKRANRKSRQLSDS